MIYIGIDPGKTGGIAWICQGEADVRKMPATEHDVCELLAGLWRCVLTAGLEKVHAMRGKDGRKQGVASAFTFGQNYGTLRGCLTALKIPFCDVTPTQWQREFGLAGKKHPDNTAKKNAHKQMAQQLFPHLTITHATADALLIAEYLRRRECKAAAAGEE
jgi:hypothetical protein